MTGAHPRRNLLKACGALRPGGQFARQVEHRISMLALETLRRIHRGDLEISDDDSADLHLAYWGVVMAILFPGANPYRYLSKMHTRRQAGEAFDIVDLDPIEAHRWPVVGNA